MSDPCSDPDCQPCAAQGAYEADQAGRAQQLAADLQSISNAILAPARWLLSRLSRRSA